MDLLSVEGGWHEDEGGNGQVDGGEDIPYPAGGGVGLYFTTHYTVTLSLDWG